jgi:hypothetical protein
LFLTGIASVYWITPAGPGWWGIAWIPLIFLLRMIPFLIAAPSPYRRPSVNDGTTARQLARGVAAVSVNVLLLIGWHILAIATGIVRSPPIVGMIF